MQRMLACHLFYAHMSYLLSFGKLSIEVPSSSKPFRRRGRTSGQYRREIGRKVGRYRNPTPIAFGSGHTRGLSDAGCTLFVCAEESLSTTTK